MATVVAKLSPGIAALQVVDGPSLVKLSQFAKPLPRVTTIITSTGHQKATGVSFYGDLDVPVCALRRAEILFDSPTSIADSRIELFTSQDPHSRRLWATITLTRKLLTELALESSSISRGDADEHRLASFTTIELSWDCLLRIQATERGGSKLERSRIELMTALDAGDWALQQDDWEEWVLNYRCSLQQLSCSDIKTLLVDH